MTDALDAFLRPSSASAKFPTIGTTVEGTIVDQPSVSQANDFDTNEPATWKDGNPIMQMVVRLQTTERDPEDADDDGIRTLYVRDGSNLKRAVVAAMQKAKAKIAVGGTLSVTYVSDGEKKKAGLNAPKMYSATYAAPDAAAQFLAAAQPDPAPATAQAAAPQAAAPAPAVLDLSVPPEGVEASLWGRMDDAAKKGYLQATGKL
ncbi:hypothetical protein [Williamsia sp.]|uniref:hypothetical protein n=1 Tax=Williamsia sp. TaxID=1872085 RepID=UPI002F92A161